MSATDDYLAWVRAHIPPPAQLGDMGVFMTPDMTADQAAWAPYVDVLPNNSAVNVISQIIKWNALDKTIDPSWAIKFAQYNNYFKQGQFRPNSAFIATPDGVVNLMKQADAQWIKDNEPSAWDNLVPALILAAAGYGLYSTWASLAAQSAGTAADVATITGSAVDPVSTVVSAADVGAYGGAQSASEAIIAGSGVAPVIPISSAIDVTKTIATAPTPVAASAAPSWAADIVAGAKAVVPVVSAGTALYNTVNKPGTAVKPISYAAGGGLPATNAAGTDASGLPPLNYSGILKQLAVPGAILLVASLLKG